MEDKDNNLYNTIDYMIDGDIEHLVFFEDIAQEFNLEVESYWLRDATKDDWFTTGDYVVSKAMPIMPETYEHAYSILYTSANENTVRFADHIITELIEQWSLLEACYDLEYKKEEA